MGLSKSKTVQKNDPWAPAQPFILKNLQQQDDVFSASQPALMQAAADQRATYGRVAPGAEQGIMGAQNLVNSNLSGANLNGNPYLDAILGKTRQDVTNSVGDQFGMAGRFGGGMHQDILEQRSPTPRTPPASATTTRNAPISRTRSGRPAISCRDRSRCLTTRPNCRGSAFRRRTARFVRRRTATARRRNAESGTGADASSGCGQRRCGVCRQAV
jgi:hypothetical protein